jgi:WD40 repeat protein
VIQLKHLGPKACRLRAGLGVRWEMYVDGYEPQVINVEESARAVVERAGGVFVGSKGSIQVMNGTSLETERTLLVERKFGTEFIFTLSVSGALLLTGHGSGAIVAWDVETGARVRVLQGHDEAVTALAADASRLLRAHPTAPSERGAWRAPQTGRASWRWPATTTCRSAR